jgi:hypothetical protein
VRDNRASAHRIISGDLAMKRIVLFLVTNLAVMLVLSIAASVLE